MVETAIGKYFGEHAVDWGKHYQGTTISRRIFNRIFRRALKQRWDLTMKYALPTRGKTYLDIGCGTGAYSLALAKAGAAYVTGIDFAEPMIDLSRRQADIRNLSHRCEFVVGDFIKMDLDRKYDMVIAMGVFDYVADYESFWRKMIAVSKGTVIASFPGHGLIREPMRRFRYRRKNMPVHFYDNDQLKTLGRFHGLDRFKIKTIGGGFVLIGFVK